MRRMSSSNRKRDVLTVVMMLGVLIVGFQLGTSFSVKPTPPPIRPTPAPPTSVPVTPAPQPATTVPCTPVPPTPPPRTPVPRTPAPQTEKPKPRTLGEALAEELLEHGSAPVGRGPTPISLVVSFANQDPSFDTKVKHAVLAAKKDVAAPDVLGALPDFNESLRLTLRSVKKHLLCAPQEETMLTVEKIFLLVDDNVAHSIPQWLRTLDTNTSCANPMPVVYPISYQSAIQHHITASPQVALPANIPPTMNVFTIESLISTLGLSTPHFLYVPSGILFGRKITREDLFERVKLASDANAGEVLIPRVASATDMSQNGDDHAGNTAFGRLHETNRVAAEELFGQGAARGSEPSSLRSFHIASTYMFSRYVVGRFSTTTDVGFLTQLNENSRKKFDESRGGTTVVTTKTLAPFVLHAAMMRAAKTSFEHLDGQRSVQHLTFHFRHTADAVGNFRLYFENDEYRHPLSVLLYPRVTRFWSIQRDIMSRLAPRTAQLVDLFKTEAYESSPLAAYHEPAKLPKVGEEVYEKEGEEKLFSFKPVWHDKVNPFPCGPTNPRVLDPDMPIPTPKVADDLRVAESASAQSAVPDWDATTPMADSASPATIASMMCYFPGRPPHAFDDEMPEVKAAVGPEDPTFRLSRHVAQKYIKSLGEYAEADASTPPKATGRPVHHRLATVDVVYTYVKGDATKWLAELKKNEESRGIPHNPGRIRDWDELKYSLRSIRKYLCKDGDCCGRDTGLGVGTVYILVDSDEHVPEWAANFKVGTEGQDDERESMSSADKKKCRPILRFIPHNQVFPGAGNNPLFGETVRNKTLFSSFIPTYNSNAIESTMHRIPGLRKHFIYLNNDFLFGRPHTIIDFFRPIVTSESPLEVSLEPLLTTETVTKDMTSFNCKPVKRTITDDDLLYGQTPETFDSPKCADQPYRAGFLNELRCREAPGLGQWNHIEQFIMRLTYDRLEGMPITRGHCHVPVLYDRDIFYQMMDVDFRDVTAKTRNDKFRDVLNLAPVLMYMYYGGAQRRARGTLKTPSLCAPAKGPDSNRFNMNYRVWRNGEVFRMNQLWRKFRFVTLKGIEHAHELKEKYRTGELPKTALLAINDEIPHDYNATQLDVMLGAFRGFMDEAVSGAPKSWWERS